MWKLVELLPKTTSNTRSSCYKLSREKAPKTSFLLLMLLVMPALQSFPTLPSCNLHGHGHQARMWCISYVWYNWGSQLDWFALPRWWGHFLHCHHWTMYDGTAIKPSSCSDSVCILPRLIFDTVRTGCGKAKWAPRRHYKSSALWLLGSILLLIKVNRRNTFWRRSKHFI